MKKILPSFAAAAALVLASCVAETVERRKPRKGPVKAVGYVDHGGGAVRYSVEGWSWFVAGRRRDALRRMRRNCGKDHKPRLVDEYLRDDADIAYSGEDVSTSLDKGIDHFKIAPFQHLRYDCVPKGAAEPPAVSTSAPAFLVVPPQGAAPDISTSPAAVEISTAAMIPDISTPTETAP